MPNGGSIGHRLEGLTEESTEAEVDAYLSNPAYYPVGMFDDTFDGNGDPMQISPLFRQDLAGNRCEGLPVCKSDHILIREAKTPPIGIRVDNAKLLDLNAYQVSLQSPAGETADARAAARGRESFRTAGCRCLPGG